MRHLVEALQSSYAIQQADIRKHFFRFYPVAPVAEKETSSFQFSFFPPRWTDVPTALPGSHGFFLSVGLFLHVNSPPSRLTALPSASAAALRPKTSHSESPRLTRPAAPCCSHAAFCWGSLFYSFLCFCFRQDEWIGGRGRGGVRSFMSCSIMRIRSTGWVRCVNIWRTEGHCGPLVVGGGNTPHWNFFFSFFQRDRRNVSDLLFGQTFFFFFIVVFFRLPASLKKGDLQFFASSLFLVRASTRSCKLWRTLEIQEYFHMRHLGGKKNFLSSMFLYFHHISTFNFCAPVTLYNATLITVLEAAVELVSSSSPLPLLQLERCRAKACFDVLK